MKAIAIILLCIVAAVAYGVAHDQITARVCVEYFTMGHPPVFPTDDPMLLGIGWGVIVTWWVGLLLGVPLAVVARAGARPKSSVGSRLRPLAWLLAERLPPERHVPFLADLWAHTASYVVGLLGGIVVMILVWRARGRGREC